MTIIEENKYKITTDQNIQNKIGLTIINEISLTIKEQEKNKNEIIEELKNNIKKLKEEIKNKDNKNKRTSSK